jgi:protein O-GlcNAc transferase
MPRRPASSRHCDWNPRHAEVHVNLAAALRAAGRLSAAIDALQQALVIAPDLGLAHSQLGHLLKTAGEPEAALPHFRQALALQPDRLSLHSELLFMQGYLHPTLEQRRSAWADARRFGERAASRVVPYTSWSVQPDPEKRLRIGLVSGDLRTHPVGYFVESVLAALRADDSFEVLLYANHADVDTLSQRLQTLCLGWKVIIGMEDATAAAAIRDDGVDVLIDLSGHTNHNRLPMMALKPAPVQLSWLGYCATTGLATIDAYIADRWIVPAGSEGEFVERIVRLPDSFLCFTPPPFDVPVGPLPASTHGQLTWGCFNHLAKMNDAVVALWSRILLAVPGSRLALMALPLSDAAIQQQVAARFARHGIPADRLWLQPARSRTDYLAAYRQIDMALDPFPYPGGTTSAEALWMGVPVLTLAGESALSRQGASLMHNVGLPDWVACDADHCVQLAVRHAQDLEALAALRQTLRARLLQSPVCDAPRFAAGLASCLRQVWRLHCQPGSLSLRQPPM